MRFVETSLAGAMLIDVTRAEDDRGFFGRTFCVEEFRAHGLDPQIAQCNVSFNRKKGTLRGMHYQCEPHEEAKLVRCTMGAIHDVVVDLRPESPTLRQWYGVALSAESRRMLYVPRGCAHGFISLCDDTEVFYQMSRPFVDGAGRGVLWNDPAFGIRWPIEPAMISERDAAWPLWS